MSDDGTKSKPPAQELSDEDIIAEALGIIPMQDDEVVSLQKRDADVLNILPVYDAPNDGHGKSVLVKRGPGRPRKVEKMLTRDALEYHAEISEAKIRYVETDPIVIAIDAGEEPARILHFIKSGVAREAASLSFERIESEKRGRDTSMISSRRIDALKKIAEIELKLRELEAESVNLSGEKIQKLFGLWVDKMRHAGVEVMSPEVLDLFLSKFATGMETWEEEAEQALRKK